MRLLLSLLRPIAVFVAVGALTSVALAFVPDLAAEGGTVRRATENIRTFFLFDYGMTRVQYFPVWEVVWASFAFTAVLVFGGILLTVGPSLAVVVSKELAPDSLLLALAEGGLRLASGVPVVVWASVGLLLSFHLASTVPTPELWSDGSAGVRALVLGVPVLVLAMGDGILAGTMDRLRSVARTLGESDAMVALRARGLSPLPYLLRGLVPAVADEVASRATLLVGAAVVVEVVFNWRGVGWQILEALRVDGGKDYPLILASVTVLMLMVLLLHALRDLIWALTDPRAREARG